jgi:hypothetical protein
MANKAQPLDPLESYFAATSLGGLIKSGVTLLKARRVRVRTEAESNRFNLSDFANQVLYYILIAIPAVILEGFQRIRTTVTRQTREYPRGSWQYYLGWKLREDLAHHTVETQGYHIDRPAEASELDDLTAWIMTTIQFVWGYEELMGVIWDESIMLKLVEAAAEDCGMTNSPDFIRLQRQWEVLRPYGAPLNGTYADVRRAAFENFIRPKRAMLPREAQEWITDGYERLAATKRVGYQKQMSLLAKVIANRYMDEKDSIPLWDARIGLIVRGRYYLLDIAAHDEDGYPVVYGHGGGRWRLQFRDGEPIDETGEQLILEGEQLYRLRDHKWAGYLDMTSASRIEWQLQQILSETAPEIRHPEMATDVLLAETPRSSQRRLRGLLPAESREELRQLSNAPVIINWDAGASEDWLAKLRRAQRGIGDHALTIRRTDKTFIFDQSHVFFDGTWSLAMAEVFTSAAVQWCRRIITITPSESTAVQPLRLQANDTFRKAAEDLRQTPEVTAETTIFEFISLVSQLRTMLSSRGAQLTINDLLIITRIFHAAHYIPTPSVQREIDAFAEGARSPAEKRAVQAIKRSLERGRITNPALLIPVDASVTDPQERIFPITFRNLVLADNLVWVWDNTWDAYQAYRRIEPPDTPEGIQALKNFALKRALLIGNLIAFSHVLAANKNVGLRGDSLNIAILKMLVGLPPFVQHILNYIPEQFSVLNEVIKGDEVYSNVGRVAQKSSLTRFMSAKDDGNTKALVWGIMSDDQNRLIITMRDFRPHVKPLIAADRTDLAQRMAQDYLTTYTAALIGLVARLSAMLQVETTGL